MRRLLEPDHVVFLPLILEHVRFAVAVAELDPAAVRKLKSALRRLIGHRARKLLLQRQHMVFVQLRQRPAQQQKAEPRITKGKEHELSAHRPRLAAAARAAVGNVPRSCEEEPFLLRVRLAEGQDVCPEVLRQLVMKGVPVCDFHRAPMNLEKVFMEVTQDA